MIKRLKTHKAFNTLGLPPRVEIKTENYRIFGDVNKESREREHHLVARYPRGGAKPGRKSPIKYSFVIRRRLSCTASASSALPDGGSLCRLNFFPVCSLSSPIYEIRIFISITLSSTGKFPECPKISFLVVDSVN